MPKLCKHSNRYGKCNQPVEFEVDKSITNYDEWMTGRTLPWNGGPEIIPMFSHSLVETDLCYYHHKVKNETLSCVER